MYNKIEELRSKLEKIIEEKGIADKSVLHVSRILDKYINKYMKLTSKEKKVSA